MGIALGSSTSRGHGSSSRSLPAVLLTLAAMTLGSPDAAMAAARVLWVGDEPACSHSELQSAVDEAVKLAPREIEIRLAHGVGIGETIRVRGGMLELTGGWARCGSAERIGRTILSGASVRRVFDIGDATLVANSRPAQVEIRHLTIIDGFAGAGAGIRLDGGSTLRLYDSDVVGNVAVQHGGGIAVFGGSMLEIAGDSLVAFNLVTGGNAPSGGGIACTGPGEIYLGSRVEVSSNQAVTGSSGSPGRGGGLYLADGCRMLLSGAVRVGHNRSTFGAGVFAGAGTVGALTIGGADLGGVPRLIANELSNFGIEGVEPMGGAMFLGPNARITFERLQLVDNGSSDPGLRSRGGAVALDARSELVQLENAVTAATTAGPFGRAVQNVLHGNGATLGRFAYLARSARLEIDPLTRSGLDVRNADSS